MSPTLRLSIVVGTLFCSLIAVVLGATQHYLPKYSTGGTLVDSTIVESAGGGNIGIGTTAPDAKLRINQAANAKALHIDSPITGLTQPTLLVTYDGTEATAPLVVVQSGSPKTDRFRIAANGNVGIGTASPTAKLHVSGNVAVDGNIGAKYQDVAEWVRAAEPLTPGTVVVADTDHSNRVRGSQIEYDTAVAGVVSRQPGIILGDRGAGNVAVAQSGRVKVKVDAQYGAIQRGDLLVTSPTKGHAMRSQAVLLVGVSMHRPGTILGKALEPLTEGAGEILVLITLQ